MRLRIEQLYVATDDGAKELNLVTSVLINYTMAIGVNEITEDNIDDSLVPHCAS